MKLTLGDNFSDNVWKGHFTEAVADWNMATVLDLEQVAGQTSPRRCKASTGNIEVCAERYGNTGWLGIAQIWVSGDHITKALAKMNDYYFDTPTYDKPKWRQFVMCQEVGHDFGLGHQDETFGNANLGSCMDYTDDPDGTLGGFSNQKPNDHDYSHLEDIYSHLDLDDGGSGDTKGCRGKKCRGKGQRDRSTPDASQPPPPAFGMELPDSGQWGRAIAVSRNGGQSVFVQDFGNGYQVYTHVTWTLEVAETLAARR